MAPGLPLALLEEAYGARFARAQVGEGLLRRGEVAVVEVFGPLEQRRAFWWDSYEAILSRVTEALEAQPSTLLLRINSPGGLVSGCFEAAEAIRDFSTAADVPVVAYVDGTATSAAYALACAADRIVTPATGMVGSVGVIAAWASFKRALDEGGVDVQIVTSGARKADGSAYAPITDEAVSAVQRRVNTLARVFFDWVSARRGLDVDAIQGLEAAVMHGEEAVERGLADEVGTLDQLLADLAGQQEQSMSMSTIAVALGLSAEASESEVHAAAQRAASTASAILRVTGQPTSQEALATIQAWKAGNDRAEALSGQLAALETARAAAEFETDCARAASEGRLTPAQRTQADALANEHGYPAARAFVSALPKSFTPAATDSVQPPAEPAGRRAAAGLKDSPIAKMLGTTAKELELGAEVAAGQGVEV